MSTLVNSEDPDEMLHNVAFHQGLHYLLIQKQTSVKNTNLQRIWKLYPVTPYTMDHPKLIASTQKIESIIHKGLNMHAQLCKSLIYSLNLLSTSIL